MIILITGGSACGKSEYAEMIAQHFSKPLYYVATMQPYGDEGAARVKKHRSMREGKGFITIERYTCLAQLDIPERGTVLLECIGNLTANEAFSDGAEKNPYDAVISGVTALALKCENLVIVTNEVGADGYLYDESTQNYVNALGKINSRLAEMSDCVYELCVGIPISLKGGFII